MEMLSWLNTFLGNISRLFLAQQLDEGWLRRCLACCLWAPHYSPPSLTTPGLMASTGDFQSVQSHEKTPTSLPEAQDFLLVDRQCLRSTILSNYQLFFYRFVARYITKRRYKEIFWKRFHTQLITTGLSGFSQQRSECLHLIPKHSNNEHDSLGTSLQPLLVLPVIKKPECSNTHSAVFLRIFKANVHQRFLSEVSRGIDGSNLNTVSQMSPPSCHKSTVRWEDWLG